MVVGRLLSYWEGNFSGAMLNFWRVVVGFNPGSPKTIFWMFVSVNTFVLVGIYTQQFQGTMILMVFDFQGSSQLKKYQSNGIICRGFFRWTSRIWNHHLVRHNALKVAVILSHGLGEKKTIQEQHRQTKRQSLKGRFWIPLGEYPNVPREYCPTEQAIYSRYMLAYIAIILRVLFEGDPHFSVQISKD